jgi:pimeloyl-ACP methyl ester carboxylesterase
MKTITIIILAVFALILVAGYWLWTPDKSRAQLERDYLSNPADMIDLDGVSLHVRDTGPKDAPAVIMIHGFGASLHTWNAWSTAMSDTYRVVRFDLPGSGLSPPDPDADYTDARVAALLLRLMDRLGIDKAALIGNSIGGRIAWRTAAMHPGRIRRLVLVSPDGFASPGFEYDQAPAVPAMLRLMRYTLPKFMVRSNLAQSYGDSAALNQTTVDRYYDLLLAPGSRQALLDRLGQTVLSDPRPVLPKINIPVLLVWGEKDALIPFSNAQDYLASLPDARLVSFPELGHVPHEEAPMKTLPPVMKFLSGQD